MIENSPTQRNHLFLQIVVILVIILLGGYVLYRFGIFSSSHPNHHTVTYRLVGSASTAEVSYTLASGEASQLMVVAVPWRVTVTIPKGTVVILTAGNPTHTGDLGCELLLDGKEWKQAFAKSPEDKISCAGIVP
ncbi:MAG: MmpS family transport accessory protein [Anaerolineales bacterium]